MTEPDPVAALVRVVFDAAIDSQEPVRKRERVAEDCSAYGDMMLASRTSLLSLAE